MKYIPCVLPYTLVPSSYGDEVLSTCFPLHISPILQYWNVSSLNTPVPSSEQHVLGLDISVKDLRGVVTSGNGYIPGGSYSLSEEHNNQFATSKSAKKKSS